MRPCVYILYTAQPFVVISIDLSMYTHTSTSPCHHKRRKENKSFATVKHFHIMLLYIYVFYSRDSIVPCVIIQKLKHNTRKIFPLLFSKIAIQNYELIFHCLNNLILLYNTKFLPSFFYTSIYLILLIKIHGKKIRK